MSCFGFVSDFQFPNTQLADFFALFDFSQWSTTDDQYFNYTPHKSTLNTAKSRRFFHFSSGNLTFAQSRLNDKGIIRVPRGCFGFVSDFYTSFSSRVFAAGGFMAKEVTVKILKFHELFTKRNKDIPKISWFSMPCELLAHPDFIEVTGDEWKAFCWFVGIATMKKTDTPRMNIAHTCKTLNIKEKSIFSMIEKLEGNQLHVVVRPERGLVTASTEQNITLQDITEHNIACAEVRAESHPQHLQQFPELNYFNEIKEISSELFHAWVEAYPLEYLANEFKKAKVWCLANPKKKPRAPGQFLSNWLSRGFEQYRKSLPSNKATEEFSDLSHIFGEKKGLVIT